MIGTRKGLWIARSDDRARRWKLDGPDELRSEVLRRALVDTPRRTGPGCSLASIELALGPAGAAPTTSAHLGDGPDGAHPASPRTPAPPRAGLAARARHRATDVVWAGTEPRRCSAPPTAARPSRWCARSGTTRTASSGAPGSAGRRSTPCCRTPTDPRPADRRDVDRRRLPDHRRRRLVGARQPGHPGEFLPEEQQYPEFGQCVHKVARHPPGPDRLYAQNHGGVYRSDDGAHLGVDRRRAARRLRLPGRRPPARRPTPSASSRSRAPRAASRSTATCRVWRSRDAGETWEPLGDGDHGAARRLLRRRDARRACAPTTTTRPALYFGGRDGSVWGSRRRGRVLGAAGRRALPDVMVRARRPGLSPSEGRDGALAVVRRGVASEPCLTTPPAPARPTSSPAAATSPTGSRRPRPAACCARSAWATTTGRSRRSASRRRGTRSPPATCPSTGSPRP